jgi:hypothetical protein
MILIQQSSNAQPIFGTASGCKESALLTTEQFLNPGTGAFTQERPINPGEDTTVVLGAWTLVDSWVADPTAGSGNCPFSPGDGNPTYVVRLVIKPVSGDPAPLGIKTVTWWSDNDVDGQFTPGRDTQFGPPLPGVCLTATQGCELSFGNAPVFTLPDGGAAALSLILVAEIENPVAGATLQVRVEAFASDLVNLPAPFSSGFAPQFKRSTSNIRVRVEGAPGGAIGGVLSPSVNNASGNPETGLLGIEVWGIRTRGDVGGLAGTQERDARPGDREYFVGMVVLCEGGDLVTDRVKLLPPIAGPVTIAGGLASIPCIGPGDGDGNGTNVVRIRVGVSGPGAQYIQSVHVYADTGFGSGWVGPGLGGTLFEPGELVLSQLPINGIAAVGSLEQTLMTSGGTPLLLPPGGLPPTPAPFYVTVDISDQAQVSQVTLQIAIDVADIPGTTSSRLLRVQPQEFSFRISGAAPPAPAPGGVQQFDANGNCVIDDPEFFNAIDQWIAGRVSNELFFRVVDAWISQTNVCVGSSAIKLELDGVELRATGRGVVFEARGQGIASLGVEIYSLSGERIFAREVSGTQLTWTQSTDDGRPVANGVYLYVVTVKGADGQVLQSEVRKLVVLR